jgi:hypothetical protein
MAAALLVAAALGVAGCCPDAASSAQETAPGRPARVKAVPGKDVKQVTLTEQAARRVGIETITIGRASSASPASPARPAGRASPATTTAPVSGQGGGGRGAATVVPYSAVLYAPDGETFVYTVTQPLTYVREKVTVATVRGTRGDQAVLSTGPPAGTEVVTVGVIELYGAELGVGE